MSNSRLIHWFNQLLFGGSCDSPPSELKSLILRLESEDIPWSFLIREGGGLTRFPQQVHGDLNSLIDYLENRWLDETRSIPPSFRTRAVSKFWDQLQLLLARRFESRPDPPLSPSKTDDETLQEILESSSSGCADPSSSSSSSSSPRLRYESADFWGEIARRFILLRRPLREVPPLPDVSPEVLKRALELYRMTCQARGLYMEPFTLHLVPHSDYVNAVHWQTDRVLETFMHHRPDHPLTTSVQTLLQRSLNEFLRGEKPSAILDPPPHLDGFLHNLRVIHGSVQQIPHGDEPPRLVDVVQRLLALCHRDGLWERDIPKIESNETSLGLLYLTEQLTIAERERQFFWLTHPRKHIS